MERLLWLSLIAIGTGFPSDGQAQKNSFDGPAGPLEHANVALPTPAEYPGYNKFLPVKQEYQSDPLRHYRLMQAAWREPDQTSLELGNEA